MKEKVNEKARKYLQGIRVADIKIRQWENFQEELMRLHGVVADQECEAPETMQHIERISQDVTEHITECDHTKGEVVRKLLSLENELQRTVLFMRYVKGVNLTDIAESLGYCKDYIFEVHKKGVNAVADQMQRGVS